MTDTVLEITIINWLAVFFEDRIFYRLLIVVPLKMYRKFGQPNAEIGLVIVNG